MRRLSNQQPAAAIAAGMASPSDRPTAYHGGSQTRRFSNPPQQPAIECPIVPLALILTTATEADAQGLLFAKSHFQSIEEGRQAINSGGPDADREQTEG